MGIGGGLVRKIRRRRFFRRGGGDFYYGVYRTFDDARKSIPPGLIEGFDNETGAGFYRERLEKVFPADYPALFWLRPLIQATTRLFDFGGHVGLHYYAWKGLLELPATARWIVADVPAVCAAGMKLAKERGVSGQLSFAEGLAASDGMDVLFSGATLQYLEPDALPKALAAMSRPPPHLVLNKIPVVDGDGYFTVQDTGVFQAAYSIFSRPKLTQALQALRYDLVDAWTNPGRSCHIVDSRRHFVKEYSGFYLRRAAA